MDNALIEKYRDQFSEELGQKALKILNKNKLYEVYMRPYRAIQFADKVIYFCIEWAKHEPFMPAYIEAYALKILTKTKNDLSELDMIILLYQATELAIKKRKQS